MRTLLAGLAAAALTCTAAYAQAPPSPAPVPRADAYVVAGWQNLRKEQPQYHYNDWLNGIFYGGGGAGWLWTDHLKTQVDVGAGTRARQYRYEMVGGNGGQAYQSSRLNVREQNLSISQQYQFFRNQWFHPHVGAGVEIARETTTTDYDPVVVYDNAGRVTRTVLPARSEGPEHRTFARGLGEVGFKAYMTEKTFFTADMRVMFRGSVDEVLLRAGFGIDF